MTKTDVQVMKRELSALNDELTVMSFNGSPKARTLEFVKALKAAILFIEAESADHPSETAEVGVDYTVRS